MLKKLTKYILEAFKDVKITDKNLNLAIELLKKWDFKIRQIQPGS